MSNSVYFALLFAISAGMGFLLLFHAYKVQAAMLSARDKHRFLGIWIWRWLVVSPYYILILRMVGVVAWLVSAASLVGLMNRR
jgi:hypothetical protein